MVLFVALCLGTVLQFCRAVVYTNEWAIRIRGDAESVNGIAEKYGFTNLGQIGDLKSYYSFRHHQTVTRSNVSNRDLTAGVAKETKVEWLQQQVVQKRAKRNLKVSNLKSKTKHLPTVHHLSNSTQTLHFSDQMWSSLWYIHCSNESKHCQSHMNIAAAWRRGYTGKGVVVSVLDDGIEREHPDLKPNYDPLASYDVNGQDQDPSPNYSTNSDNYHGTQCAGMVAATANNSQCTVGVSFYARIGGIRMLDGDVTDIVEAQSLSFGLQYIDIYVASWGPEDDGATLEGPGPLTRLALQNGIKIGRYGRGSVFIWGSGNGGRRGDHCSCDGYSSSIFTVSISSSTRSGSQPDYLEQCPSTLATAYTGGETQDMVTLGPQQSCSQAQSGASLSSAMAAGVIALTLEANPLLTWRDVQHIIVRTSKAHHLIAPDWHINGAGYKVSHLYGFGLLDAESMVKEAEHWKQVPSQHVCVVEAPIQLSRAIHPGSVLTSVYETTGCSSKPQHHVVYLEHVVVRVTIAHSRRGDLSFALTSPSGTVSQLLANRPFDNSTEGFHNWEFMTTHCWGEQAAGEWTLKIQDTPSQRRDYTELGTLKDWSLVIYGTAEKLFPVHRKRYRSAEMPMDSDLAEEYSGPCDPECSDEGCEGPSSQQCVTCLHFFLKFKNNTSLQGNRCQQSCTAGFYHDKQEGSCKSCHKACATCAGEYQDSNGTCHVCDATCLKCTGPQSKDCISCDLSRALDEGHCVEECPKGKYQSGGRCHLCDHTCATCVDAGPANCTSCDTDKFEMERYLHNGQCVDACPEAFYHTKERSCAPCSDNCQLCTSPTHCLKCNSSYYVSDGACVKLECGEGQVEDPDYDECMACEEGCRKCVLSKTYTVEEDMTCVPCDDNCVSCDEHECYWCETDLFLSEGQCVSVCPDGFYADENSNDCEECHSDCVTCSGLEDNECLSCEDGKTLENGECVPDHEVCPLKTFRSDDGECEDCHPSCASCSGEEKNQCTKCAQGLGFPAGQVCRSCAEGCATCGRNATHCLTCEENLFLHQHQCVEECPPAHSVQDGECLHCPSACQECSALGQCTGCDEYHFLHEGLCVRECPETFYEDKEQGECLRCHPDCALCDGPNNNDCDACLDPKNTLHNGACLAACPSHSYRDTRTGECEDCDASCLTCFGPHAGSCTSCREGWRLEDHSHCVQSSKKCLTRQYAGQDGECHPCHKYCHRCSGPGKTHCLSCNQRHLLLNGTCVDECPAGYYEDEPWQKCEACHPSCQSCFGKHSHECLVCKAHLFREGKECVETCKHRDTITTLCTRPVSPATPAAKHAQESLHACEDCDSSCLECRGPGPANCTTCPTKAILESQGRCLLCCRNDKDEDTTATQQQECCNCTKTQGECVLSTNLAFRNEEEEEGRGNLTVFIVACILLVLVLVAIVFLIRYSRSKSAPPDIHPRGYAKLGSHGGSGRGSRYGGYSSASSTSYSGRTSSSGSRFQEAPLVDISERHSEHMEDEDEDIVYMGQDGTVYRKFRYGQLGEDNEDELEYDDESYTFR
ncbi:Proprotein convertase subtilisin/kexin type 5 [Channa argus]|uniref:SPC3 n=1 Tax=Channa argus TaxID=215402 RepID=A0A6G1QHI6_CHAAH|nr:Proprotein convertase subtilisin/kexin type 5 [Channa argus]